jgi:hypothetical protein
MSSPFVVRATHQGVSEFQPRSGSSDQIPLRKAWVSVVIENPYVGSYHADLSEMIEWGTKLGHSLGKLATQVLNAPVLSYGKGAIVGMGGEQEHGVALLTSLFGDALREEVGGGVAWISSATKVGAPSSAIDIPLAHKDALYVRDHYDAVEVRIPGAPMPDEIAVICAVANRGRLDARCGGPSAANIEGKDGLR